MPKFEYFYMLDNFGGIDAVVIDNSRGTIEIGGKLVTCYEDISEFKTANYLYLFDNIVDCAKSIMN